VKPEKSHMLFLTGTRLVQLLVVIAAVAATFVRASGEEQSKIPTVLTLPQVVEKLLEQNAQRAKALQSYRCKRVYALDYKGFPKALHGEITVEMNYRAPDRKDFKIVSESGPKWLVTRVLRRLVETEREAQDPANRAKVELNPRNYDFMSLEHLATSDGCAYTLSVQPKIPSKFLYRGRVWVNEKDFAVCRIEAEPAQNPSMWITKTDIRQEYQKIGDFWLPLENRSISTLRLNGRATLTIKYGAYEINAAPLLKEGNSANDTSY